MVLKPLHLSKFLSLIFHYNIIHLIVFSVQNNSNKNIAIYIAVGSSINSGKYIGTNYFDIYTIHKSFHLRDRCPSQGFRYLRAHFKRERPMKVSTVSLYYSRFASTIVSSLVHSHCLISD